MWFWVYMVLAVFILLNVFITILGEAYDEAKDYPRARSKLSYHPLSFTPFMSHKLNAAISACNQLLVDGTLDDTDCTAVKDGRSIFPPLPIILPHLGAPPRPLLRDF